MGVPKGLRFLKSIFLTTLAFIIVTPSVALASTSSISSTQQFQAWMWDGTAGGYSPDNSLEYSEKLGVVSFPDSFTIGSSGTYFADPAFSYDFSKPVNIFGWSVNGSAADGLSLVVDIFASNGMADTENQPTTETLLNTQATRFGVRVSGDTNGMVATPVTVNSVEIYASTPAPTGLTVSDVTSNSATLSWSPVAGATGYSIKQQSSIVGNTSGTSFTLTGLTAGTSYGIMVMSDNVNGASPPDSTTVTTTNAPVSSSSASGTSGGTSSPSASNSSTNAEVNINGSALSLSAPSFTKGFGSIILNGHTQTEYATLSNWSVVDPTGTGNGWNVALSASQLTEVPPSGGFSTGTSALQLPKGSLSLTGSRSVSASTGSEAVSSTGGPLLESISTPIDNGSPVKILSAATGYGMGTFIVHEPTNSLALTISPQTKIDTVNYPSQPTPYESTLTYSVVSGP